MKRTLRFAPLYFIQCFSGNVYYSVVSIFAIIGSIGVVTQIPNFQKFLNKNDIDAFLFTAGKHKRTVDVIGDVTEEGKAKLQEECTAIQYSPVPISSIESFSAGLANATSLA